MPKKKNKRSAVLHLALPATSANLGPAFDAAALAMDLYININARPASEFSIRATGRDPEICQNLENHFILTTYRQILNTQAAEIIPLSLRIRNDIPIGKGCGSSAAARLAGIALANHFGRLRWTDAQRLSAKRRDREHHPDNAAACWMGGLAVARMSGEAEAQVVRIQPKGKWPLLLAVPDQVLSTEEARRVLPAQYSRARRRCQHSELNVAACRIHRRDATNCWQLRSMIASTSLTAPHSVRCFRALQEMTGTPGILGAALSGAGPSVVVFLDPRSSAQKTRKIIASHLASRNLQAELLLTSIASRGARS